MSQALAGRLSVLVGDITRLDVDVIVNAANERLLPGGGVCGAIHRVAGPELARACARVGGCPTGEARLIPGFKLKARHVIHAVGPIRQGGDTDSIAAILGAWLGALHGESGLPGALLSHIHDGPYGPTHLRALGDALAAVERGETVAPPRYSRAAALARNLALYPVVLAHGFRRLIPL